MLDVMDKVFISSMRKENGYRMRLAYVLVDHCRLGTVRSIDKEMDKVADKMLDLSTDTDDVLEKLVCKKKKVKKN